MADDMLQKYPSEEQALVGHVLATIGKMFMTHLCLRVTLFKIQLTAKEKQCPISKFDEVFLRLCLSQSATI
jgi:hypothetical protein